MLGPLQPVDVGDDPQAVALGLGGGEDHGLERDRVGAVELLRAELRGGTSSACWIVGRVGLLAGGQQGERDQAGRPGRALAPRRRARSRRPAGVSLRNRTPSRMACSTSSLVTPARRLAGRRPAALDSNKADQPDQPDVVSRSGA